MVTEQQRKANSTARLLRGKSCAVLLLFILSTQVPLTASEHNGQVTFGGVPVSGATVTAAQGDMRFVAITDTMGRYAFSDLPYGAWTIEVEMSGFATVKGDTSASTWELKMLPLGEIHAEVAHNEWRGSTPLAIPVAATPNAKTAATPPKASTGAFANLSPEDLNQRAADGLLINGTVNNGATSPFTQPVEHSNMPAVLAQPLYYGGIGIFRGVSSLDARSFSLTGQDTPKPVYSRFTVSFNFGGPLVPKKDNAPTFFIGYQRVQNPSANTTAGRMPTATERSGDFSQSVNAFRQPAQIIDPLTDLPFAGNVISKSRISPQARSLLTLFPLPNSDGRAPYNYQMPIVDVTHQDVLQTRLNESLNTRNQIFGSFDMQSTRGGAPNLFNFLDTTRTVGFNTAINWATHPNRRFSATFRYQFSRLSSRTTPYFANRLNVAGVAGINGSNQDAVNWGPPSLVFSGGTSGLSDAQYSFNRNQTNTFSYSSFWNRGRHNVTFGGDVRRQQSNVLSQLNPRGTFTFTGAATGLDLADFLLGIPGTSSIAFGNADKYFRQTFYDAFITDDWKMNDALTVNAGVRWEYEAPISELYGRLVNLNIAPGFSAVTPVVGNTIVQPDRGGIEPRVSFAWRPISASSLIVRGGYGVYRNTNVYQSIAIQMAQQSPLSKSLSVQNTSSNPLNLANGFITAQEITPNTFAIDPNYRVGYAQSWTLSLQYDLPAAVQMTAVYLGTKGTRLPQESLPNTFPSGALNPAGYIYLTSNGNSIREAGQIQLRRRLRSGFTATAQYTYSKALDDAPLMAGSQVVTASTGGTSIAQNWLDLGAERGPSNFDQRHQLTIQGQYSTGVGVRGGALLGGLMGAAFKEWTITSSLNIGSGLPETPIYFAAVPGTGVTGSLRPDVTGASIYAAPAGLFLNPAAFREPASGQWGNAGRNSLTGPSQFGLNASLGRTFRWGGLNMDLRMDVTNVLNHVTFKSWDTTVNNAQFGLPSSVNAMRSVQPTLRVRF